MEAVPHHPCGSQVREEGGGGWLPLPSSKVSHVATFTYFILIAKAKAEK
jgi:hypothetical protein